MSIADEKRIEQIALKPFLKMDIGSTVYLKSDTAKQYPMLIIDFDLDDSCCNDYRVKWFDSKGTMQQDSFPQECLLSNEINNQ